MHVIYVDDERPALENFKFTIEKFTEVKSLVMFQDGESALEHARTHSVNIAFLDMQMPGIHGLELAVSLKEINSDIMIIFVTAYSQYALDAWNIDASGYLMKPYMADDIKKYLDKYAAIYPIDEHVVTIETIPTLSITVKDKTINIPGGKTRELFALLVDRGNSGLTPMEGIAYLWPDRPNDTKTQSLFRVTYKRVIDALANEGLENILTTSENRRYLRTDKVDCDLYKILSGDMDAARKYSGAYLREYTWSEERNAQLYHMFINDGKK